MRILICVLFFALIPSCKWSERRVKREIESAEAKKKAYVLGYNLGGQIKRSAKEELDQQLFLIGLRHGLEGKASLLSREGLRKEGDKRKQKGGQKMSAAEEGKRFLEANKQKPGVTVTSSGLQYKALREGAGRSPSSADRVEAHYRGTFINGEEFDSSYKRGKSSVFPLNGVIKGWTEGLQLMREGAEYEFYIPPELGYGSSGAGGIPPGSVLIFKVELIKVL